MYKLCVFGGTTEGRELVEFLNTQPCRVTACVATEYGQTLLPEGENLTVSARPMPVGEIGALLQAERFDLVIDATHPYAASITRSIAAACEAAGVEHWRLLRGASEAPEDAVFAENTDEAVRFLSGTEGTSSSRPAARNYRNLPPCRTLPRAAGRACCRCSLRWRPAARRGSARPIFLPCRGRSPGRWTRPCCIGRARAGSSPKTAARPAAFRKRPPQPGARERACSSSAAPRRRREARFLRPSAPCAPASDFPAARG